MAQITEAQKNRLIGRRVQLHPATDRWMMGDRYGVIVKVGREYMYVKLDKSGKTIRFLQASPLAPSFI